MAETQRADAGPDAPIPTVPPNGHVHAERPREAARIRADDERTDRPPSDGKPAEAGDGRAGEREKGDAKQSDDKKADKKPSTPLYKRPFFWIAIVLLAVGVVAGVLYYLHARHYETTDDAFIDAHVVQISPQVSARVQTVYVDDNTHVKAGDSLFDLDPTDYKVALDQQKGNENAAVGRLEQVKAQVVSAGASRDEAKANLDAANVAYINADRDLKRYEALDDRARSKQQYDNAVTSQKNAAAQVEQSKARVASAESQIAVAIANVAAAQGDYETAVANRKRAEVNLSYCFVKAPTNGRVTSKNVEPGTYASTATPMLAIVQDDVWVVANYKETQLTDMKLNQPVSVKVDAYPDVELHGRINSIQAGTGARFSVLPAENATGNYVKVVQRVPVKITFDGPVNQDNDRVLAPGMSVVPYVTVR